MATVVYNQPLTAPGAGVEVRHLLLRLASPATPYLEGQSFGVIPPGLGPDGKAHRMRLYSVASGRAGEDGEGHVVALCVKRVGLCSNYLCDLSSGERLCLAGPYGGQFLLPGQRNTPLLLVAAGTGIAPMRGFLQHMARTGWQAPVHLYYGVRNEAEASYMNVQNQDIARLCQEGGARLHVAYSQGSSCAGERLHVQRLLERDLPALFPMLEGDSMAFYLCGMRKMAAEVEGLFASYGGSRWEALRSRLKKEGRWHIEAY